MRSKPPDQSLQDILDHINLVQHSMKDISPAQFREDLEKRAAIERWLQNITEAGFRLGDKAAVLCPDVDWPNMRGLGNRLRHADDLIDAERIHNVAGKELLPLRRSAEEALRKLAAQAKTDVG